MPTLFGSGVQGKYDFLVIQLLGASLDSLYRKSGQNIMDLRSVCCIAMQVVRNPLPPHQGRSLNAFSAAAVVDTTTGDDA